MRKLPVGGFGRAQDEVVDSALGEAIDPLLGHRVGNQNDGKRGPSAWARAAASNWPIGMPGSFASSRTRPGGFGAGDGSERGLGGENHLDARAGGQKHWLDGAKKCRVGRRKEKSRRGVRWHPGKSPCWMHRHGLEKI